MSQDAGLPFSGAGPSYTTPEKRTSESTTSNFPSPPPISNPFPRRLDGACSSGFQAGGAKEVDRNRSAPAPPLHGDTLRDVDADASTQPGVFPPAGNVQALPAPPAVSDHFGAVGGPPAASAGCGAAMGGIRMSPLTQHPTTNAFACVGGGFGAGVSTSPPSMAPPCPSNPYSLVNPNNSTTAAAPATRGGGSTSQFPSWPPPVAQPAQHPPGFEGFSSSSRPAQQPPGFGSPSGSSGISGPGQQPTGFGSPSAFSGISGPAQQPPGLGSPSVFSSGVSGPITPIKELSPYGSSRWRIKARVTSKRDIRRFTNSRGEGQLFSVELVDKSGGECSATFFGKAVDVFYSMLSQGQVYMFAKGRIKPANSRFDKGLFALTFDEHSLIEAAASDDRDIPGVQYSFRSFADIAGPTITAGTPVDIMGVICDVRGVATIMVKSSGSERSKREIVLWDGSGPDSNQTLDMTIWGDRSAEEYELGAVVFVRAARVNEWNGSKSVNVSGQCERNPDDKRAFELLARYKANGRPQAQPRAQRGPDGAKKTLEQIQEEDLHLGPPIAPGQSFDPNGPRSVNRHLANSTVISQIVLNDRAPFYFSCPAEVSRGETGRLDQCKKKVSPLGDATPERGQRWRCDAGHECQQPKARFFYRAEVADHTGSMEVSVFDEVGQRLFGCDADTLARVWEDPLREGEKHSLTKAATWKRVSVGLRSRKEAWNDQERINASADSVSSIALVKDATSMLAEIRSALGV